MERNALPQDIFQSYLSNFSDHPVEYRGVIYKTAEHAYHCQRYTDPAIIEEIRGAPTAAAAWEASQRYKPGQAANFDGYKLEVMKNILRAKLEQHSDVREALIQSGDMEIVKEEPKDAFWGAGPDGSGRNELGKLWMDIRTELLRAG